MWGLCFCLTRITWFLFSIIKVKFSCNDQYISYLEWKVNWSWIVDSDRNFIFMVHQWTFSFLYTNSKTYFKVAKDIIKLQAIMQARRFRLLNLLKFLRPYWLGLFFCKYIYLYKNVLKIYKYKCAILYERLAVYICFM